MSNIKTPLQMIEAYEDLEWLTHEQITAFTDSLNIHIRYVQEAGKRLGVSASQLEIHDWSKWTREEFPGYARQFFGGKSPVDAERIPDDFARAWLHHIHHGEHHWQHWIFSDEYSPKGSSVESGVVEMPVHFALEMVADWMGASMAYAGSWDMTDWLSKNMPRIRLHSKTMVIVRNILDSQGYADTVYLYRWMGEAS